MGKSYDNMTWQERLELRAARYREWQARRRAWERTKREDEYLDGMVIRQHPRVLIAVKNWR